MLAFTGSVWPCLQMEQFMVSFLHGIPTSPLPSRVSWLVHGDDRNGTRINERRNDVERSLVYPAQNQPGGKGEIVRALFDGLTSFKDGSTLNLRNAASEHLFDGVNSADDGRVVHADDSEIGFRTPSNAPQRLATALAAHVRLGCALCDSTHANCSTSLKWITLVAKATLFT